MYLRRVLVLVALTALLIPVAANPVAAGAAVSDAGARQTPPDLLSVSYLALLPDSGHVRFVRASRDGSLLFAGLSNGGLTRSADGGATWTNLRVGVTGGPGAWMLDVEVAPSDRRVVWAAGLSGVFRSTDGGVTWTEADVRSDEPGRAIGSVLAIDPWHPEAAYLAGYRNGGLYRTGDGGLSWQQVLPYPVSSLAIEPSSGATIYVVSRTAGFQRSNDHGHTWSAGVPMPAYPGIGEETAAPGRLVAYDGLGGVLFVGLDGGQVEYSRDGGRSWHDFSLGLPRSAPGNGYAVPYDLTVVGGAAPRLYAIVPSGVLGASSGGTLYSALLTLQDLTPPTATTTPTPAPTHTATPSPTRSPSRTATPSPSRTAAPSPSSSVGTAPVVTTTATAGTPTIASPSVTPSATPTVSSTVTLSPVAGATDTPIAGSSSVGPTATLGVAALVPRGPGGVVAVQPRAMSADLAAWSAGQGEADEATGTASPTAVDTSTVVLFPSETPVSIGTAIAMPAASQSPSATAVHAPTSTSTPSATMTATALPVTPLWEPVAEAADAVSSLATASSGLLVAAEAGPGHGQVATISALGGSVLFDVTPPQPGPIAAVGASGFVFGRTQVGYLSGINYEGPNDRPWQMWQDGKFDASPISVDLDDAAAAGYKVLRVFVQDPLPAQVLAGEFGHIDTLVSLARQRDLRLLITFNDSRDPNMTRVAAVDRAIAAHYAGNTTIFGYDLQNEPGIQDIAGAIYPPGVSLPLLSDAIVKRYGAHYTLASIHADRAAGEWEDGTFAHMSEQQVYLFLNAEAILNDYFDASPSAADQRPGGRWWPLLVAVNASLAIYLQTQLDAVRAVDSAHLVTVGYNSEFWAGLPANDVLSFRCIHLYPSSQDFDSIHGSLLDFESLLSGGNSPQVLEEYGFSTAAQSSALASVQETGMSLYLRTLGGSGDFKWQLNDDTVGSNAYENGLGLFGAGNVPKVAFYVNREIAAYFGGPHQPGGVRMWSDGSSGLGYLYSAPDALGASGGSYSDARLSYATHDNAATAQLWLDWAQPGRLRIVSSDTADLNLNLAALTGAITGTVSLVPAQQFVGSGTEVHLHLQAGVWYTLSYKPGGHPVLPIELPAPPRKDGWYILAAGHNVAPPFLTRWLALGGVPVVGAPFAEPQPATGGSVQYYAAVAMQAHGTSATLLPLGLAERGGKADPRAREMPKKQKHLYFSATGHNLSGVFLQYWQSTGGASVWGVPLTEEFSKEGLTVQYFTNAEFVWNGSSVSLGPLGARAWARAQQ